MDFSTHNFVISLSDDQCILQMKLLGFDSILSCKFDSTGDLLSVLLNRSYYPDLVSPQELCAMSTKTNNPDKQPWHYCMDAWDHNDVYALISEVYQSKDAAINSLKPSQRFRVHLAFQPDMFAIEYVEQPYSYPHPLIEATNDPCGEFVDVSINMMKEEKLNSVQAKYKVGCRIVQKKGVHMPKLQQYWFSTVQDMIMWLLRYIMEHDKYIKKCECCGKYFVPKRSTKMCCSDLCTNRRRDEFSFYEIEEAKVIYKRIVSNLTGKANRFKTGYCLYYRAGEMVNPQAALKEFYKKNSEKIRDVGCLFADIKKQGIPPISLIEKFELEKSEYVKWLQSQYDEAISIKMDRESSNGKKRNART